MEVVKADAKFVSRFTGFSIVQKPLLAPTESRARVFLSFFLSSTYCLYETLSN